MTIGLMEVNLVDAHGLTKFDCLHKIDPYVLIQYRDQEHKSSIAKGEGSNPKWNQKFTFRVEYPGADAQPKLVFKIMDHDTFSSDDHVGQTTIYLKEVLEVGVEKGRSELRLQKCSVVDNNQSYRGLETFELLSLSPQGWKQKVMHKNLEDGKRAKANGSLYLEIVHVDFVFGLLVSSNLK